MTQITTKDVRNACSEFLTEVQLGSLYRLLPTSCGPIVKQKVRHDRPSVLSHVFEQAFNNQVHTKAVFASTTCPDSADDNTAAYRVYPPNGFNFMYCPSIEHTSEDYKQVIDQLMNQMSTASAFALATDILKDSYTSTNLREGITKGAEVILYRIPFYYAVRIDIPHLNIGDPE